MHAFSLSAGFLFMLLLLSLPALSQAVRVEGDTLPTLKPVLRINVIGPGLGIEAPASERFSIYVEAGANFDQVPTRSLLGEADYKLQALPYANLQVRFFYNLYRRQRAGKRVDKQSANFLGISAPYVSASSQHDRLAGLGPVWGLQRHFGEYGFIGFLIGPGFYLPRAGSRASSSLQVHVNTWLGVGFAF
jgi:hypothetical protein